VCERIAPRFVHAVIISHTPFNSVGTFYHNVMVEPSENDDARRQAVVELHEHLAATAELPIERTANRWIGEAEAVAADLVEAPNDADLIRKRATHIVSLLDEVGDIDNPVANKHVAAAARLADRLCSE